MLIGLTVRRFQESFALRFQSIAQKISAVLFVLVLLGIILKHRENIVAYYSQAGSITLALNILMLSLAWFIGSLFASGSPQRIAISMECGLQNGTVAIAVASILDIGPAVIPAATYSLTMFGTALIFIYLLRRHILPNSA